MKQQPWTAFGPACIALVLVVWAPMALAQDAPATPPTSSVPSTGLPSNSNVPSGGAQSGYYIPGAPVPQTNQNSSSSKGDKGTKGKNKGGRIGSIEVVDRSNAKGVKPAQRPPSEEIYGGVVPGHRDWQLWAKRRQKRAERTSRNRLSWVGFINRGAQGNRVFIQTVLPSRFTVQELAQGGVIEVILDNTSVPRRNERRPLDTRYWPTVVMTAQARARKRQTVVTITLQRPVEYQVRQEGEFIYIDFDDAGFQPYFSGNRTP